LRPSSRPAANDDRDVFTPTLTSLFINGSNELGLVSFDVATLGSFFTATTFVGAVKDSADTWWSGWTCNSTAANFGTTNTGSCTSLPTT